MSYPFLIQLCEVIIYSNSEFDAYNDGWSPEDTRNYALAYLKALESFFLQRSFLYLRDAVKLQGQRQDIVYGIATISDNVQN